MIKTQTSTWKINFLNPLMKFLKQITFSDSYFIIFTVPPEPPTLYTARTTSSSLMFHWRLSSNGDAPIIGYTITYHMHPRGAYKQVMIPRHTTSYYLNVSDHITLDFF